MTVAIEQFRKANRLRRLPWISVAVAITLTATQATAQTAIPPNANDFAMAAAQSDQYEIVAGRVAIAESQNPRIKAFAQIMIDEHRRTSETLAQAATASGLPPPLKAMSSDQATMLSSLQSLRGADFDKAYVQQQVLVHVQAMTVGQSYASAGTDPNLKAAASATAPIIQHHLQMAQRLSAELGGS